MDGKSVFLQTFGESPMNKVLDFLVVYEDFDYPMIEIAHKAGIGYATLKLFWKRLIKKRIVIQTRLIGRAKLYKLNTQNPIVQQFKKLYWTTIEKKIEERTIIS